MGMSMDLKVFGQKLGKFRITNQFIVVEIHNSPSTSNSIVTHRAATHVWLKTTSYFLFYKCHYLVISHLLTSRPLFGMHPIPFWLSLLL